MGNEVSSVIYPFNVGWCDFCGFFLESLLHKCQPRPEGQLKGQVYDFFILWKHIKLCF